MPLGVDATLIRSMNGFDPRLRYMKTIAQQAEDEWNNRTDEEFLQYVGDWLDRVEENPSQLWVGSQTIRWLHAIATEKVKPNVRSHPRTK